MNHEQCRTKVCVVCSKKSTRIASKNDIISINTYIDEDFAADDPDYPRGICSVCQISLSKKKKGQDVKLHINQAYKTEQLQRFLRSVSVCRCSICDIAKTNGLKCANSKRKAGRPPTKDRPVQQPIKVCSLCFQQLYQGCRHQCSTDNHRRNKVYNLEKLMTPTTSERVSSRTMARCSDDMATLGHHKRPLDKRPVKKVLFQLTIWR